MAIESRNKIMEMTYEFAGITIEVTRQLEEKRRFAHAQQLFKSGTSVGANVREAQGAESKADFRHKMKIAYKEAEETEYWLSLIQFYKDIAIGNDVFEKLTSIKKVLGKIITTSSN